ncbi:MAG: endonuclease domain-containing protein [Betaproteobacteria bacterium]|nr:endonuclease domain-containing protein [Betaproteobacteria bacterium]
MGGPGWGEFARICGGLTDAEQRLWHRLRGAQLHGCKFRRQHPIGPWFADFACIERRLVVELDGGQHAERAAYDRRRTEWLRLAGWRVARFWDNEVLNEMDGASGLHAVWAPHGPLGGAERGRQGE